MSDSQRSEISQNALMAMTADIVSAYLAKNAISAHQVPELINTVFSALCSVQDEPEEIQNEPLKPAVAIRKSVTPDYIVCLEDGKKLKMLKRHLRSTYNMSPDEYRVRWGLPADYPMVAPNYAAQRSEFAKMIGLGRGAGRPSRRSVG